MAKYSIKKGCVKGILPKDTAFRCTLGMSIV